MVTRRRLSIDSIVIPIVDVPRLVVAHAAAGAGGGGGIGETEPDL